MLVVILWTHYLHHLCCVVYLHGRKADLRSELVDLFSGNYIIDCAAGTYFVTSLPKTIHIYLARSTVILTPKHRILADFWTRGDNTIVTRIELRLHDERAASTTGTREISIDVLTSTSCCRKRTQRSGWTCRSPTILSAGDCAVIGPVNDRADATNMRKEIMSTDVWFSWLVVLWIVYKVGSDGSSAVLKAGLYDGL